MTEKVSILVPCYNEADTIMNAIEQLQSLRPGFEVEIIVVDDGSTDDSTRLLTEVHGIKLVRHERNKGKGAAIATGATIATGKVIVIQDADLEYDPKEIPELVNPILTGECDIVYGSRFRGKIEGMTMSHCFGNKILSYFTSLLYGVEITDMMTGHKAFRASIFKQLPLNSLGFGFEMEVTVKALKKGIKITEVPIPYSKRKFGKPKIRWRDGIKSIMQLFEYRFGFQ